MAKKFEKNESRTKKRNPITETKMAQPENTFNLDQFSTDSEIKVGRPKKNKTYGTIRLQKNNVNRVNALQNTLDFETQDDLIAKLLDRMENSLEQEQKIMFEMYMKTYTNRDNKKKKL